MFKKRLLKYEPIDLAHFVVDLREKHLFWIIRHLILVRFHERAIVNAPLIINGAPSLQRGPWLHICHTFFPGTCFSTFFSMFSAVWDASDFGPTPYGLKQ